MKRWKKALLVLTALVFSFMHLSAIKVSAASFLDCEVTLKSPHTIEGMPLYETNVVFTVTNKTDSRLDNLLAYLSFADIQNGRIYDDEFGAAGETVIRLPGLAAKESTTITIPLQIAFAGHFLISASVVNPNSGSVAVSDAISVTMTRITAMNNSLVIMTAVIMPVICLTIAVCLTNRKKMSRQHID